MTQKNLNSLIFLLLAALFFIMPELSYGKTMQFLNTDNESKWRATEQAIQNVHDFQDTYGLKIGLPANIATNAMTHFTSDNSNSAKIENVILEATLASLIQYSLQLQNPDSAISGVIITPKYDGKTIGVSVSMRF